MVLASRKHCDLKTWKSCFLFPCPPPSPIKKQTVTTLHFAQRLFCDFRSQSRDFALCDMKTPRYFCDCDFSDAKGMVMRQFEIFWFTSSNMLSCKWHEFHSEQKGFLCVCTIVTVLNTILTTPTPHICKNMPPKYAIQWGSVWHKSRLKSREFYRKYGIRTPKIWHTKPPPFMLEGH